MNKKVLITGATRGIGKEIALNFAKEGYDIAINFRNIESSNILEQELLEINKDIEVLKLYGDISKYEDCEKIFKEIKEKWNCLDVLVNNAGVRKDNLVLRMSEEDFRDVIDVNLVGVFFCMKFATKLMLKNKFGRIISISSVVGVSGNKGQINYAASKAGVIAMTKSLAQEIGRKNITVNAISPGFIESDMTETLEKDYKDEMLKEIPLSRFGSTKDIADMAVFLASEKASYITGQNIIIDGGLL